MASWLNGNSYFNGAALAQNIPIGSQKWVKGGLQAYSGSTGDHPAYGWLHDHKIQAWGLEWVKAVFANYNARRPFYANAPQRLASYEGAGRPVGYFPQQPGDMPKGEASYETPTGVVLVSGPDILHFHIGPLLAVFDLWEGSIQTPQGEITAKNLAGLTIRLLMKSLAGMLRKGPQSLDSHIWDNRGTANIIEAVTEATQRGLVDLEDFNTLSLYIVNAVLPFYEKAPGFVLNTKPPLINNLKNIQLYNGLYWMLPPLHWASKIAPDGMIKDRIVALVRRFSQYMEDLEVLAPGNGCRAAWINTPQKLLEGVDGKPLDTWIGTLSSENIFYGSTDWSMWGMTAQFVAAEVLNSAILKEASKKNFQKWLPKRNVDNKVWFVDANQQYL